MLDCSRHVKRAGIAWTSSAVGKTAPFKQPLTDHGDQHGTAASSTQRTVAMPAPHPTGRIRSAPLL
jgi:hypothetical protein